MVAAGAMLGVIVIPGKPAQMTLGLPSGVPESVPDDAEILRETFWQWNDAPLPSTSPDGVVRRAT